MARLTINQPDRVVDVSTTSDAMTCEDYYTKIDELLSAAREELSPQDMMDLINTLGVVLDMHCDGIRREVESEYDEE